MADGAVVGSAEFELRASRAKIQGDMEAARREVEDAAKKTEASLGEIVGTGTAKGAKKGADALKDAGAAGVQAGDAIRESMRRAGEEVASSVSAGAQKAKAELDALARKAKEVQQVKMSAPTIPTEATHRLETNPINGVQSWVPKDFGGGAAGGPELNITAPDLKATTEATKELTQALDGVKPSADNAAEGLGGVSRGGVMAGLGIAALVGTAALVAKTMWDMGRAAIQSAGDIADSSKKIGVSTDALQEWRFVATKSGEDAKAADAAIGAFAEKLALAGSRMSKEAVKDFAALGFSPEQLKSFKSTEEALDAVVDRIGDLKSESDRAAIAHRLGLGPLGEAIRAGADEVANLRDEAHQLGAVMGADVVARGAEAQTQFETLSRVIDVQLKTAFVDLAPVIITAISLVNDLAKALSDALQEWKDLESKSLSGLKAHRETLQARKDGIAAEYGTGDLDRHSTGGPIVNPDGSVRQPSVARRVLEATPFVGGLISTFGAPRQNVGEQFDNLTAAIAATDKRIAELEQTKRNNGPRRADNAGGNNLTLPPARTRTDRSAEREARRAERVEQEIFKARQRYLGLADNEFATAAQRFEAQKAGLAMDRAARKAELDSRELRKDITDQERKQLEAEEARANELEDRLLADRTALAIQEEQLAAERMLKDFTLELLGIQAAGATTERERRKIDEEILRLKQIERRQMLKRIANDPTASEPERQAARDNIAKLPGMEKAEKEGFARSAAPIREAGQIAQGIIDQDGVDSRYADMYAEIDRLRQADVLSEEQAERAKGQITSRYLQEKLSSTSEFFGNLATLSNSSNKELAAIGKAAAIAQATIDGVLAVQKALASAPPPMNFALAAAAGATAAVNVAKIAGIGFAEGGYTGDGGKYEPAGVVHKGEFVIPKEAVSRIGIAKLQALRFGHMPSYADGGLVSLSSMALPGVTVAGGGAAKLQRMVVEVDLKNDMLDAKIDGRAAPMIAHGSVQSARYAKNDTINTLTQQQTYRRGG